MNAQELAVEARRFGADLVGIAPAHRWEHWPNPNNPRQIQPRCESVVVIGRRVLRGALRGVEEGTSFSSTYAMYGKDWNEMTFLVRTIHQVALALEAAGAEAVPMLGGGSGLDSQAIAHEAGLGSMGKGGFFLTPEFGHRQRFGLVLTDLAMDGNPVINVNFCQGCEACLKACPLSAMTNPGGEAGFELNRSICSICANGRFNGSAIAYERLDRFAAACGRACMVALEDKIDNRFNAHFRKRSVWTRDIDGHASVHPLLPKGVSK